VNSMILGKISVCHIRHNYQLKWSNGDSLDIFNKIFADKQNYSSMMGWLKNAIKLLPKPASNILIFCTLTGLRADESFKSIELFHSDKINYLNDIIDTDVLIENFVTLLNAVLQFRTVVMCQGFCK
ncbi:MAG: hypothetical protein WBZ20_07620, partial [Nitrososphaeraceae archaeon]